MVKKPSLWLATSGDLPSLVVSEIGLSFSLSTESFRPSGESLRQSVEASLERAGAALGVVQSAAVAMSSRPETADGICDPDEAYEQAVFDLELLAESARSAGRKMAAAGSAGSIVAIVDVCGIRGRAQSLGPSVASGGCIGFVKSMAKEYGRYGIRVNVLAHGEIEGSPSKELSPTERQFLSMSKLARAGSPASIALALAYLCDPGSNITGQILISDGGAII